MGVTILSVGGMSGYNDSNTCLHRTWALEKFAPSVDRVDTRLKPVNWIYRIANRLFQLNIPISLHDLSKSNKKIIEMVSGKKYDLLWIDKGITVNKKTLITVKKINPNIIIVGYSPDEMTLRHNQSQNFLKCFPYYDYYITTKSYAVEGLKRMGCPNIIFVDNAYEDSFHYIHNLSDEDKKRLGGDVGFIGAWEQERADSILYLAQNDVPVRVWGDNKWLPYKGLYPNLTIEDHGLFSDDYPKAFSALRISLCFLRKMNNDRQTSRSIEIPACGGFMLAERTDEHLRLFEEGKEAEFFSDNEELLTKCRYYLANEDERKQIAMAGNRRCTVSGYSNRDRIKTILNEILTK